MPDRGEMPGYTGGQDLIDMDLDFIMDFTRVNI